MPPLVVKGSSSSPAPLILFSTITDCGDTDSNRKETAADNDE